MDKELYADSVANIHYCVNMVKIDLVSYIPEQGQKPQPELIRRLVMPPAGLLALADSANAMIEKLIAAGVVQRSK